MNEASAIDIVTIYFQRHGYKVKRLDENNESKIPDFEIFNNDKSVFLCELKSPSNIQNKKTELFHWSTTVSKLHKRIHKAVKQFKSHNPKHSTPWVLVFTSSHSQLNWKNFADTLNGVVGFRTTVIKDLRSQEYILRTNKDIEKIDLFIWLQINEDKQKIYQLVYFVNSESFYKNEILTICKQLTPYATENIVNYNLQRFN